jgi:hypothetical protein
MAGFRIRFQMDLTVLHTGKCMILINDLLKGIGKAGRFHAVQNNGSHCHLTDVVFSSGFSGNNTGQQKDILCLSTGFPG